MSPFIVLIYQLFWTTDLGLSRVPASSSADIVYPLEHTCTSAAFEPTDLAFPYQSIGRYTCHLRSIGSLADLLLSDFVFHCQSTDQISWHASHRPGSHMCRSREWHAIFTSTHFWHAQWDPKKSQQCLGPLNLLKSIWRTSNWLLRIDWSR
jgi:hypothetical protein